MLELVTVTSDDELRRWVELVNAKDAVHAWPYEVVVDHDEHRSQPQLRVLGSTTDGVTVVAGRVGTSPSGSTATLRIVRDTARSSIPDLVQVSELLEAWAVDHGCQKLRIATYDYLPEDVASWERRGWCEAMRKPALALDVRAAQEQTPPPPTPGIVFATLAQLPGRERQVYETYVESWSGTPWSTPDGIPAFERWWGNIQRWPGSAPDQIQLALDGDSVVGYAELEFGATGDPSWIWNGYTGVRPDYRRRGIALALKLRCVEWARRRGVERMLTSNHADNVAIRSINARLGYEPAFEYVMFERVLTPDAAS